VHDRPQGRETEARAHEARPAGEAGHGGGIGGLDRFFKISERGSSVRTELVAGITTWLTMAYILFLNPQIFGFAGIPDLQPLGLPFGPVLTVTALVAGLATIAKGLWANYPFAIAPGLGLNAFVAFTLVAGQGLSYPEAMGVIVVEGLLITVLVLTGFRNAVLNADPDGPEASDRHRHRPVPGGLPTK
jgi:AGZA family xanthine/uracil permease-like MFS transporter